MASHGESCNSGFGLISGCRLVQGAHAHLAAAMNAIGRAASTPNRPGALELLSSHVFHRSLVSDDVVAQVPLPLVGSIPSHPLPTPAPSRSQSALKLDIMCNTVYLDVMQTIGVSYPNQPQQPIPMQGGISATDFMPGAAAQHDPEPLSSRCRHPATSAETTRVSETFVGSSY